MALSPLNTDVNKFPLSGSPFYSRVSTHAEEGKNYSMLAFNPGFALQAAELNEIQELFFLNQSLSLRMYNNWITFNTSQTSQFKAPFWEGLVPLSPNMVSVSSATGANPISMSYTIQRGWYLYTDKSSNLSYWIHNPATFTNSVNVSTDTFFGLNVSTSYVGCCQTDEFCLDQDKTLRDASQSFYQEFTCGASRFKTTIDQTAVYTSTVDNPNALFSKIFVVDFANQIIKYPNEYVIYDVI